MPGAHQDTCSHMCYTPPHERFHLSSRPAEYRERSAAPGRGGERLTVTVDRRPVAEIVPLHRRRTVPGAEALHIASGHAADPKMLEDVRSLLSDTTDDA